MANTHYIRSSFKYCSIEWIVKKISFLKCPKDQFILSPVFKVNYPQVTKWRLGLKSSWNENVNTFSVLLERLECDGEPETVWVNWRVEAVVDPEGEENYHVEDEYYFEKRRTRELDIIDFPTLWDIYEKLNNLHSNDLEFRLDMIVDHNHRENISHGDYRATDYGDLIELSEDLRRMYNRSSFYDFLLRSNKQCFRIHRFILAARNGEMCDRFVELGANGCVDRGSSFKEEDFSDADDTDEDADDTDPGESVGDYRKDIFPKQDPEALEKVLRYLYTGNARYIFLNPTVALYRCINYFKMNEILIYFPRQYYVMESEITTRKYTLTWPIAVRKLMMSNCQSSDWMDHLLAEETWELHLYPYGVDGQREKMDFFVEYTKGKKNIDVCVEFSAINQRNTYPCKNRVFETVDPSARLGVEGFFYRCDLQNFLQCDRELILRAKFKIASKVKEPLVKQKNDLECLTLVPIQLFYYGLSVNLAQLYKTRSFTDVTLIAEGMRFSAHRCILAARSKTFREFLSLNHIQLDTLTLGMKADALESLLTYIYTGEFDFSGTSSDWMKLYETAVDFGVPLFKNKCTQCLIQVIAPDTVTDILLLADDHQEQQLKHSALEFIWKCEREGHINETWQRLVSQRPNLFQEISSYLNRRRREALGN